MNFNQLLSKLKASSKTLLKSGQENGSAIMQRGKEKATRVKNAVSVPVETRLKKSVKFIDESIGVSQVAEAQNYVSLQENSFLKAREHVHQLKVLLDEKQDTLNETRKKLDRCDRSDSRYLSHVGEEHTLLLEVFKLQRDYKSAEDSERERFSAYSSAVRLSHEKERSRVERTKYWSVIGSITGTVLGFMFSSLLTQYRLSNIRDMTETAVTQATAPLQNDLLEQRMFLIEQIENFKNSLNRKYQNNELTSVSSETMSRFAFEQFLKDLYHHIELLSKNMASVGDSIESLKNNVDSVGKDLACIRSVIENDEFGHEGIDQNSKGNFAFVSGNANKSSSSASQHDRHSVLEYINISNLNLIVGVLTLTCAAWSIFSRT